MMRNRKMNPVVAAVGTVFAAGLAASSFADTHENPFGLVELEGGYDLLAKGHKEGGCGEDRETKEGEGKCGEGKCGEGHADADKDAEGKCGEGKCGGEGGHGDAKAGEGKCGEGKCGGDVDAKAGEGKCGG